MPHTETVATYVVEKYNNQYFIRATLNKRLLTTALKKEAECTPAEMISVCGKNYVLDHLEVKINGELKVLEKVSHEIQKNNVEILFKLKGDILKLHLLEIKSDYLFAYNNHGLIKVLLNFMDEPISYTLTPKRNQMKYKAD